MTAIINTYSKHIEYKQKNILTSEIKRYYKGQLNSYNDEYAVINDYGDKYWYKDGKLHRDNDKPATEYANGTKIWCKDGKLHRDGDNPAIDRTWGYKAWCKNGKFHRDNNKPAVVTSKFNRDNGTTEPVIEFWINGIKQ